MNQFEDNIKAAFKKNMPKIDDVAFTENIVTKHLAQKDKYVNASLFNFTSIILGFIMTGVSSGLYFLIYSGNELLAYLKLDPIHALIILSLSIIFLFYRLLDECIVIRIKPKGLLLTI